MVYCKNTNMITALQIKLSGLAMICKNMIRAPNSDATYADFFFIENILRKNTQNIIR